MKKMNLVFWLVLIGSLLGFFVCFIPTNSNFGFGILIIAMVVLSIVIPFYKFFFGPMRNNSRLQKSGISGTAKIVQITDAGVTINKNPQVKILLEVKNSLGQTYNTECRVLLPRINPNIYATGMIVPIKIDPKNELNVAIDLSINNLISKQTADNNDVKKKEALQAELEKMKQENEQIEASGIEARSIVKRYTWLGAYVNGSNPFVELELEILPESFPAYSAKAKNVINEININKFQPGAIVYVKYDPKDNTKVTVVRSA
jgi:hypothetical protein